MFIRYALCLISTFYAHSHISLTNVCEIVKPVSAQEINRNDFSAEILEDLNHTIRAFLKGKGVIQIPEKKSGHTIAQDTMPFTVLKKNLAAFMSTHASELQTVADSLTPSAYRGAAFSLAHQCFQAFTTARKEFRDRESIEKEEDDALVLQPLLATAHSIAFDKAIRLILTLHSERARACDRMAALFIINHAQFVGKRGHIFQSYVARLNRYYFCPTGHLISYDPDVSRYSKRLIKSLNRFLSMICTTKDQYRLYLKQGVAMGISALSDYLLETHMTSWRPRNHSLRRFSARFVQMLLGSHITLWEKVEPSLIRERSITRAFMALIGVSMFAPMMNVGAMRNCAHDLIAKYRSIAPHLSLALSKFYAEATPPA